MRGRVNDTPTLPLTGDRRISGVSHTHKREGPYDTLRSPSATQITAAPGTAGRE